MDPYQVVCRRCGWAGDCSDLTEDRGGCRDAAGGCPDCGRPVLWPIRASDD